MGKSAGAAPQAPDPSQLIPQQSAADKSAFNYQTDANRYNTVGPDQSQTWDKQTVFDENAYNKALADWQGSASQGTWVPGTAGTPASVAGNDSGQELSPATPAMGGYWTGGTAPKGVMPTQADYTTNKYNLTTTLSPQQQQLHDAQLGVSTQKNDIASELMKMLGPQLGSSFDTSSAPGLVGSPDLSKYLSQLSGLNPQAFDQNASDAAYSQQTRYLDPQTQQAQKALEARLSEQGFVPGTPGYQQAMQNFQDTNNRAYGAARDSSILQGAQIGHTQFGDASNSINAQIAAALQGAGFQNQAHGQGVQDLLQQRQVPMSDLNTMLSFLSGGAGSPTNAGSAAIPQGGVGALQTPDQLGAYNQQYQNMLNQYNAGVASDNNTTSTLGGLVGAIAIAF